IARHQEALTTTGDAKGTDIAAAMLAAAGVIDAAPSVDPWQALNGYAHFTPLERQVKIGQGDTEIAATVLAVRSGAYRVSVAGETHAARPGATRLASWPGHVTVFDGAIARNFDVRDPLDAVD